ncbi:MAG TPA: M1 family metallopeptidase [Thermomicrobiales bacterium]|nr:M1 family metallopeptidase [Thermomicrobiales bacterium]
MNRRTSATGAPRAVCVLLLVALLGVGCGPAPRRAAETPAPTPAADSLFPDLGDRGYDADHYTLDLAIDPQRNTVSGTVTMDATATQDLNGFSLDFIGFQIGALTVDGAAATYGRQGRKLTITPPRAPRAGQRFTTAVTYSGTPTTVDTTPGGDGGWHQAGASVYVTSEPDGAAGWFPVNDHPRDKATYTFRLTVPDPDLAVANGVRSETIPHGGTTTYVWEEQAPMASYLATVAVGRFTELRQTGPDGLPILIYAPPDLAARAQAVLADQPRLLAYFASILGPYPFTTYGDILVDADFRWSLETQTRPVFSRSLVGLEPHTAQEGIAHELAHQWFGDSVSLDDWGDIWLNEGFATYLSWLWLEHVQDRDFLEGLMRSQYGYILNAPEYAALLEQPTMPPQQVLAIVRELFQPDGHPVSDAEIVRAMGLTSADQVTSARALGLLGVRPGSADARSYQEMARSSAPAAPPRDDLFAQSVYARGAMTLQALRVRVGDATFFTILRTYADRYRQGNATTADFIRVASAVSGQDLTAFFHDWLYATNPPPMPPLLPSQ